MKETLLHYIWMYKKFDLYNLYSTCNKKVEIINSGIHNNNAGPDFSLAKILINNLEWNGNIEIHVKSSDFEKHNHESSPNYGNIILHIVYEHDKDIPFLISRNIPTLELKNYIPEKLINNFNSLENYNFNFIPCEKLFPSHIQNNLISEKLYISKLQEKYNKIIDLLSKLNNNWEATLAVTCAYTFGLKINAEAFEQLMECIDYKIIKKIASSKPLQIEALFFGLTNSFKADDKYSKFIASEFNYLQSKFNIPLQNIELKYSKLRPANFPTIRLSQLASLLSEYQNLFSFVIGAKNIKQYFHILDNIKASTYWNNHYTFGKISKTDIEKKLSKAQKELIILNAFLPIKFAYSLFIGQPMDEEVLNIIHEIPAEKNSIINKFKGLNINFKSAIDSQAFLHLFKTKCTQKKCFSCDIGYKILK